MTPCGSQNENIVFFRGFRHDTQILKLVNGKLLPSEPLDFQSMKFRLSAFASRVACHVSISTYGKTFQIRR